MLLRGLRGALLAGIRELIGNSKQENQALAVTGLGRGSTHPGAAHGEQDVRHAARQECLFRFAEQRARRAERTRITWARSREPPAPSPTPSPAADASAHPPVSILIVGGALTLVPFGVGVGYSLDSSSAQSEADRLAVETASTANDPADVAANAQCAPSSGAPPAACAELRDNLDHANRSQNIAVGSFIASGILAAGTLVTYFLWPSSRTSSDHAVRVAPWIDKRAAGSTLSVAF